MIIGHVISGTVVHGNHHFGKLTQVRRYRRKKNKEGKKYARIGTALRNRKKYKEKKKLKMIK